MPSYKITYFNGRGRAEVLRMLFAAAGVEYEDIRIERSDWPAMKPSTPFGQLPIMEVDGVKFCQSNACGRYLARKFNLAGNTDIEQCQADMFVDCVEDSIKPMIAFFFEPDETKKEALTKKYVDEQLPAFLTLWEALLVANQGGDKFLVGSEMTWADMAFYNFISMTGFSGVTEPLAKFPKLSALKERFEKVPSMAAWLEKRPKTEF